MPPPSQDQADLLATLHAAATLDNLDAYYVFGYLLYADLAVTPEGGWMRLALHEIAATGQPWAAGLAAAIEVPPATLAEAVHVLPAWRDRVRSWQAQARAAVGELPPILAWYRAGADRGHAGCLQAWGFLIARDGDDPKADAAGFEAVREGAVRGNASARYRLSWLYRVGKGTARDFDEADRWFRAACEAGQPDALVEALIEEIVQNDYVPCPETDQRLRTLMALGSPAAYYAMGLLMRTRPEEDAAETFAYFALAADLGMPHARWETGLALATGDGVPQDLARGLAEMRAAGASDASYLTMLAERLLAGFDGEPDPEEGVRLLEQAMALGDGRARWRLAEHLREEGDPAKAFALMRESAESGFAEAQYGLAEMYEAGEGVTRNTTTARTWLERAATQDHVFALWDLGRGYEDGWDDLEPDPVLALEYYLRAAEEGMPIAQNSVGRLYRDGLGTVPDVVEAARWFNLAAEQGLPLAQYHLACLIAAHDAVAGDAADAFEWWLAAAEQELVWAQLEVGRAYLQGLGVPRDPARAVVWLERAADQAEAEAQWLLGQLYEQGEAVPENLEMAAHWFERAARSGYGPATKALAALRTRGADQLEARARLQRAWDGSPGPD